MGNLGNPYGLLKDCPIVYLLLLLLLLLNSGLDAICSIKSNYEFNYKIISVYKHAHHY